MALQTYMVLRPEALRRFSESAPSAGEGPPRPPRPFRSAALGGPTGLQDTICRSAQRSQKPCENTASDSISPTTRSMGIQPERTRMSLHRQQSE